MSDARSLLQRARCFFGKHDLVLVATDSACRWMDRGSPVGHVHLSFYECGICGKRIASGEKKGVLSHDAALARMERWVKARSLPPEAKMNVPDRPPAEIRVINGGRA